MCWIGRIPAVKNMDVLVPIAPRSEQRLKQTPKGLRKCNEYDNRIESLKEKRQAVFYDLGRTKRVL